MSSALNEIMKGGIRHTPEDSYYYEYTSTAQEVVQGLIAQVGTAAYQAKLFAGTAGVKPLGVFDVQKSHVPIVSTVKNSAYGESTFPIDIAQWGQFLFMGVAASGNTVLKFQMLEATSAGQLKLWGDGYACAMAMDAIAAASAATAGECMWLGNNTPGERIISETMTVSSDTGVLAVTPPSLIEYVESIYAATLATHKIGVVTQASSPSTAEVKVNYTTGVFTFAAADGVTSAYIRYRVRR